MKNKMSEMHDVEVACGQLADLETPLISDEVFNMLVSINRLLDPNSDFFCYSKLTLLLTLEKFTQLDI